MTAENGRDELAMKTRRNRFIERRRVMALGAALIMLNLALGTAVAATAASPDRPADPFEKGAARLLERTATERLPSETNSPLLAPLATAWQRLAPELLRCPTVRSNHTVNLAIHRVHPAQDRPVVVLIHGVLSDHLTWRYVAADLSTDYEIWLVDLPGCGASEAPAPSALEPDGYSPTAMGERVLQAMQQCLRATAPRQQVTLIGHSLGGTVAIRMISAPELQARYADVQRRLDRAVLLAPCDLAVNGVPPSFRTLLGLKGWMVTAGDVLGVLDGKVRKLTKASYHVPECATREQAGHFTHGLEDGRHREAAKAMLREFVRFDPKTHRPVWPSIDPLVAEYTNIRVPVLIVYGSWDETLSSAMGHQLKDEIPGAVLVKLPGRGHSLPSEDPLRCAKLIRRFQWGRTPDELAAGLGLELYPAAPAVRSESLLSKSAASGAAHTPPAASQ